MEERLKSDRDSFFDQFTTQFYSVDGVLKVSEAQRQEAIVLAQQSDQKAAIACMEAFATTDFRNDLTTITVPTLVIHGDGSGVVPSEGSGKRTHAAIAHSELVVLPGTPHGCNVSHANMFNQALVALLTR